MSNIDQQNADIPEFGSVFVFGKSRFEETKFHIRNDPVICFSCGDEHTGVVTESGRVFMFGTNNWGQLGLGHDNNVDKPSCIKSLKGEMVTIIACGRNHTLVATDGGRIYAFGCNSENQLGLGEHGTSPFYNYPQKVESIDRLAWQTLAAGAGHSCALSKNGELYVWGGNDNGELGIDKVREQVYPRYIELGFPIRHVSCGYYHTAVVSKTGDLYTTGLNEFFQLGRSSSHHSNRKFNLVDSFSEPVRQVSCGGNHTVAVTQTGKVYSFGDGSKGQLGNGPEVQMSDIPEQVMSLRKMKVKQVSCGECHTAFLTVDGELFTCGDNRHGKLGLNQKTFNSIQFTPVFVQKMSSLFIENIASGGCHMVAVAKLRDSYSQPSAAAVTAAALSSLQRKQLPSLKLHELSSRKKHDDSGDSDDEEAERTFNRSYAKKNDRFSSSSSDSLRGKSFKKAVKKIESPRRDVFGRDTMPLPSFHKGENRINPWNDETYVNDRYNDMFRKQKESSMLALTHSKTFYPPLQTGSEMDIRSWETKKNSASRLSPLNNDKYSAFRIKNDNEITTNSFYKDQLKAIDYRSPRNTLQKSYTSDSLRPKSNLPTYSEIAKNEEDTESRSSRFFKRIKICTIL